MARPLAGMWRMGEAGAMAASGSPAAAEAAAAAAAAAAAEVLWAAAAGFGAGRTKLRRALRGWESARKLAKAEEGRLVLFSAPSSMETSKTMSANPRFHDI